MTADHLRQLVLRTLALAALGAVAFAYGWLSRQRAQPEADWFRSRSLPFVSESASPAAPAAGPPATNVVKKPPMTNFAGEIVPVADVGSFDRESWIAMISDRPELVPPQPREAPNPFKPGETMTFYPDPTAAGYVVNQEEVGRFHWAMNDETKIIVYGKLDDIRPFAEQIAESLGGRFVPDPR